MNKLGCIYVSLLSNFQHFLPKGSNFLTLFQLNTHDFSQSLCFILDLQIKGKKLCEIVWSVNFHHKLSFSICKPVIDVSLSQGHRYNLGDTQGNVECYFFFFFFWLYYGLPLRYASSWENMLEPLSNYFTKYIIRFIKYKSSYKHKIS